MVSHGIRRLPVLDGSRLTGIVTLTDLAVRTGDLELAHTLTADITRASMPDFYFRSEEHTSELQSLAYLVCRLLLEKKKKPECQSVHITDSNGSEMLRTTLFVSPATSSSIVAAWPFLTFHFVSSARWIQYRLEMKLR